jgi:hypothetical protein
MVREITHLTACYSLLDRNFLTEMCLVRRGVSLKDRAMKLKTSRTQSLLYSLQTALTDFRRPMMWSITSLMIGVIATAFASSPLKAQETKIVNDLRKSSGLIDDIKTTCKQGELSKLRDLYGITNLPIVVKRDLGSVSYFGTGHVHGPLYAEDKLIGILLTYYSETKKCTTYIILDSSVRDRRLDIGSLHKSVSDLVLQTNAEAEAVQMLVRRCSELGENARRAYIGGEFAISPSGDRVGVTGAFSCDSAVARNISSILVRVGGMKFRVSIIDSTVFLNEVEK